MSQNNALVHSVGKADVYELLSYLFAYPDTHVAQGLSEGSIADDVRSCLLDAGVSETETAAIVASFDQWRDADVASLLSDMRITYSELYLKPGGDTPIQPYESAFVHVERKLPGAPTLFRTRITMDVEKCMREAGVLPKNARKEPSDSVSDECAYLSYLYGNLATALHDEDEEAQASWMKHIETFEEAHAHAWLPSFMTKTSELAVDTPYASFAQLAKAALSAA